MAPSERKAPCAASADKPMVPPGRTASHRFEDNRTNDEPIVATAAPPSRTISRRFDERTEEPQARLPGRTLSKRHDERIRTTENTMSLVAVAAAAPPKRTVSKRTTTDGSGTTSTRQRTMLVTRLLVVVSISVAGLFNWRRNRQPVVVSQTLRTANPQPLPKAEVVAASTNTVEPRSSNNATTTTASTSALTKVVDIISIGSLLKPTFQDAQQRTFGRHPTVRNFFRITEQDDADQACPNQLTMHQLNDVVAFCKKGQRHESFVHYETRAKLFDPKNHTGWLCAQKRPVDGLHKVLQRYRQDGLSSIPEYVFIVDDDTYINMDLMVDLLWSTYPPKQAQVRTGCVFAFLKKSVFPFPYGGFGTFLSKRAIERLLQPIDCSSNSSTDSDNAFVRLACWRLNLNLLGEASYFRDGMSVSDLMYQFSSQQRFGAVSNWTTGYCLHSDHALAYFFNFYHIGVPEKKLRKMEQPNDDLRRKYSYEAITKEKGPFVSRGECKYVREKCTANNLICHYIEPEQMDALYSDVHMRRLVDASVDMQQGLKVLDNVDSIPR